MDGCFQFCPRGWQAGQVSSLGFPFQIYAVRGKGKDCGGQNNSCQGHLSALPSLDSEAVGSQ